MIVVKDMNGDTPDGVNFYLELDRYSESSAQNVLMYGINTTLNFDLQNEYKDFESRKLLNLWQPCEFTQKADPVGQNAFEQFQYFTKVYSICPYTSDWLNKLEGNNRHEAVFYPFGDDAIPQRQEKIYDVCYFGGLHGIDIALAPLVCNQFNLAKSHLKCLEAMAVGTAIVTSNVGPYSRFNTRHPGYIVNTGNGAGCIGRNIIEGVDYLLQNPDDLRDRQIKGRQLIYDRYSLEKNIGDWPATWRQIADKKNMGELGPPENVKSKKEYVSYGSVGPNDPCPCQSGVKYKSCCKDAWG